MYQACIFDLDGTLLDTIDAIAYTTNLTLASKGLGPIEREKFKVLVGDGAGKLIERAILECNADLSLYDELLLEYQKNFAKYSTYQVVPYDGIPELLASLKEAGIRIAVLSNKPHLRTIDNIEAIFGKDYFDYLQGEMEDQGIRRKPDPSGVFMVLERLGMKKEDCLYIGDTNTDMMTAKNAGLSGCGVTWGFRSEEELRSFDPAYVVHYPMEIFEIIKEKKM